MSTSGVAAAERERSARPMHGARKRGKRMRFAIAGLILLAALGYLIYSAVASNSEYYLTVSEAYANAAANQDAQIKIGGKVVDGSIVWDRGSNTVRFTITDDKQTMPVVYKGVVPDSFQPGADVIMEGKLAKETGFTATTLLAKCASKYEPQLPGAK